MKRIDKLLQAAKQLKKDDNEFILAIHKGVMWYIPSEGRTTNHRPDYANFIFDRR